MSDSAITIANTATLTNAGNDTGMTKTTGLTRVELSSSSPVTLIDAGATTRLNTIAKGKMYIKNLNDRGDGTKFVALEIHGHEMGRLYGGDFAFFPFDGGTDNDILLDPSDATTTTLEYVVFYEES